MTTLCADAREQGQLFFYFDDAEEEKTYFLLAERGEDDVCAPLYDIFFISVTLLRSLRLFYASSL